MTILFKALSRVFVMSGAFLCLAACAMQHADQGSITEARLEQVRHTQVEPITRLSFVDHGAGAQDDIRIEYNGAQLSDIKPASGGEEKADQSDDQADQAKGEAQ